MLGRNRHGFAEAQFPGLQHAALRAARLGLVGDQNHRLAGPAHDFGEGAVVRHQAGLGVHQEENEIGFLDGDLGLQAHAARQRPSRRVFEAGRVDHIEKDVVEFGGMNAAVAGDAGGIVDKSQLATGQAVEKRGFADVRPADDGDFEAHCPSRRVAGAADQLGHQRGAIAHIARRAFVGGDLVEQL